MKKLALALVCFASIAFMASCVKTVEHPEPSIMVYAGGDNYLYDGMQVDVNVEYPFCFKVASNTETAKDLANFKVYIDDEIQVDSTISGKEFEFSGIFSYELREVIDETVIKAVVTDVDGKVNTATINLTVNQPALPLIGTTFTWYRLGNTITGLDEFGLSWKGNYPKDTYAKLVPQDGVKLFIFEAEDWDRVTTDLEKAAFFNNAVETLHTADEYFEVNVTQMNMTYDDVIGTIMPDGTCHLIHVTQSHTEYVAPTGTATTITGEAK